jgi:nitrate reductase NapE component
MNGAAEKRRIIRVFVIWAIWAVGVIGGYVILG